MKINNDEWDYIIDGKTNGLLAIIITAVPMAFFIVLAIDQFQPSPNKLVFLAFAAAATAVMMFLSLLRLVVRYFFFKVYIGKKGFYFQSNPFDGKYYEYRKIRSYNEETILRQNRMRYFFSFTVKGGETKKFQLDRSVCRHEITKLKKRINKASAEKTE